MKVLRPQFFDGLIKMIKESGHKPPAYCFYLKERKADAKFMFDMQSALARLSWMQLSQLIAIGLGRPVATREYIEAFDFTVLLVVWALNVRNYLNGTKDSGSVRIKDREALDEWPVSRSRKSKKATTEEDEDMDPKEQKASLQAMAAKSRDKDKDDEDEEDEDDEDEDEDEKPKKGKKKKAKKKGKAKDDDEDDEDEDEDDEDEDEDEDDDEDEKPKKGKGKGGRFGKKKSKSKDDDDDEDEDEDDEEDDKSSRRKSKGSKKESSVKKSSKKSAEKGEAKAAVKIGDSTTVSFLKKRPGGGPKSDLIKMIPKKGIKVKALLATAKEEGLNTGKVKKWLPLFVKRGFIKAA